MLLNGDKDVVKPSERRMIETANRFLYARDGTEARKLSEVYYGQRKIVYPRLLWSWRGISWSGKLTRYTDPNRDKFAFCYMLTECDVAEFRTLQKKNVSLIFNFNMKECKSFYFLTNLRQSGGEPTKCFSWNLNTNIYMYFQKGITT